MKIKESVRQERVIREGIVKAGGGIIREGGVKAGGGATRERRIKVGGTGVQKVASTMTITMEKRRENCPSDVSCPSFTVKTISFL